jgi:hypothetical protein
MGVGGTVNNESYFDLSVFRAGSYFSRFGVSNYGHVYLQPNPAAFGKVGIGTTLPNFSLDVQSGQINASGGLCIAGDCKSSWAQVGGGAPATLGALISRRDNLAPTPAAVILAFLRASGLARRLHGQCRDDLRT